MSTRKRTKDKNNKKIKKKVSSDEVSDQDNYDELSNEELKNLKKKYAQLQKQTKQKEKELNNIKTKVLDYNRTVDIVKGRLKFAKSFHRSFINFTVSNEDIMSRDDFIGFVDAIPRQLFELGFSKIDIFDKTQNFDCCKNIKDSNYLSYILYDTIEPDVEALAQMMSVIEKLKAILEKDITVSFASYTLTNIYIKSITPTNLNCIMILNDTNFDDVLTVDFWLNKTYLEKDSLNITGLSMNDSGIFVRDSRYVNTIFIENVTSYSLMVERFEEYNLYDVLSNIANNTTDMVNRDHIIKNINDLITRPMNRDQKVIRLMPILNFYSNTLPLINDKYYKLFDFTGLPKFYVETKDNCLYTDISPPYVKLKLECKHDISLQAMYGLVVDGANEDSEAINCQMCQQSLKFKINGTYINKHNCTSDVLTFDDLLNIFPSVCSKSEYQSKNPSINPEACEYIYNMNNKYATKHKDCDNAHDSDLMSDSDDEV